MTTGHQLVAKSGMCPMPRKITMFKPGVFSFQNTALDNFDQDIHPDILRYLQTNFRTACKEHFHFDVDPVWDEVLSGLLLPSGKKRIALAHASGCRPHALAAALSVWFMLCTHMGRAFIFSPDIATLSIAREIIQLMTLDNPALGYALEYDALSVRLKAAPERRIEWMHPDTLTDAKIEQMAGCHTFVFVDQAHQCANELLEALSEAIYPQQAALIAGVPMSAQGAFKALYDNPAFLPMKIDVSRLGEFYTLEAEKVREQSGEDSDLYRSTVLAEFPQA